MARKTFLQIVNKTLVRMRENEVTSVSQNILSKLYGELVNKAKKTVEMAWNWEALRSIHTIETFNNVDDYDIDGVRNDFRSINVYNSTTKVWMTPFDADGYGERFIMQTPELGAPQEYYYYRMNSSEEAKIYLYPIPDGQYFIKLDLVAPEYELTNDADELYVPWEPVLEYAVAYAIRERGEDGGQGAMEALMSAERSLQDWIATEAARRPSELIWTPV